MPRRPLSSHIIFNQSAASHNDSWWSATSCAIWALWSGLSSITLLAPCYPGWPWALILAWSVGTEPGIGGDHKCPPPHLLQHMKVNRGHAGLIPAPDINFWSMAGASEGVFSNSAPLTSLRAPGDTPPPSTPHTDALLPFPLTLKLGQVQMSLMLVYPLYTAGRIWMDDLSPGQPPTMASFLTLTCSEHFAPSVKRGSLFLSLSLGLWVLKP